MSEEHHETKESAVGAVVGWGILAVFAIGFGWYVGAPLIIGERWADKKPEAIKIVQDFKAADNKGLYDIIRAYQLKAKEKDIFVGEFSWDAIQREGPEYEVTLLWTEEGKKRVAVWRVSLEDKSVRPQGDEASSLPHRMLAPPPEKP